jgi:hypothetical protein
MLDYVSLKKGEDSKLDSEQKEEREVVEEQEEKKEIRKFLALVAVAYTAFKNLLDVEIQNCPEYSQIQALMWLLWRIKIVLYSGQEAEYVKGPIAEERGRFFAVKYCFYFVNMEQQPSGIDFNRDWRTRQCQPTSTYFTYDIRPAAPPKAEGDKKEGDKKEGDKKEGDKKEGDKKEGDKKEGDKKEGDRKQADEPFEIVE